MMLSIDQMGELRSAIARGDLSGIQLDPEAADVWREHLRRVPADVLVTGARWPAWDADCNGVSNTPLLDLLDSKRVSLAVCGIEWWSRADFSRYALAWSCGPSWAAIQAHDDMPALHRHLAIRAIASRHRYAREATKTLGRRWMTACRRIKLELDPDSSLRYAVGWWKASTIVRESACVISRARWGVSHSDDLIEQWRTWLTYAILSTQPIRLSTKVVHCKRDRHDVYIGRGSEWGNSHRLEEDTPKARARVIHAYAVDLQRTGRYRKARELRGKRLGCYCAPKDCHGDVLAALADCDDPHKEIRSLIERYADRMGRVGHHGGHM